MFRMALLLLAAIFSFSAFAADTQVFDGKVLKIQSKFPGPNCNHLLDSVRNLEIQHGVEYFAKQYLSLSEEGYCGVRRIVYSSSQDSLMTYIDELEQSGAFEVSHKNLENFEVRYRITMGNMREHLDWEFLNAHNFLELDRDRYRIRDAKGLVFWFLLAAEEDIADRLRAYFQDNRCFEGMDWHLRLYLEGEDKAFVNRHTKYLGSICN